MGRWACRQKKIAYLNAGTRNLVPLAIPSVNLLGSVAGPNGVINAGRPDAGNRARECCPGVVLFVPLEDRLA
jgi:hypothetical protein